MSLEQDLKQEKFTNEYEKMVVNILFTGSWLASLNSSRLKPFGVTPEQYNVLRILRGSHPKPMMLADITCRMIDRNSNATRLVEKLRQKGLVNREICETNRRQVDISITDADLKCLKKLMRAAMPGWKISKLSPWVRHRTLTPSSISCEASKRFVESKENKFPDGPKRAGFNAKVKSN